MINQIEEVLNEYSDILNELPDDLIDAIDSFLPLIKELEGQITVYKKLLEQKEYQIRNLKNKNNGSSNIS